MKKLARTFALCLILIVMGCALVFSQVGVDKRPTPPPKTSPPKTTTHKLPAKRPATRSTPSSSPRTTARQGAPNIEMVLVPGGTFMMGSPDGVGKSAEHPQHQVTVQSFNMGKYEVTQAQYRAVMGTNPSNFKGDNLPVEQVSWNDAVEFCRRLSQMTGREYRLPSEAEWEYACRAGTTGEYAGNLDSMAWYDSNSGSQTHPVGQKQPNGFGLYDMHGNVWEWCEDWSHDSYNGAPSDGSAWESGGEQKYPVLRGGSWYYVAFFLRSAYRNLYYSPDYRGLSFGFRVVVART